ncbi:MAG: dihydropteroate synthase [Chitinivibrionales bacterium]|nr:dihydropteroate synthase [Chitinivibrionales bacterium]MBD3395522.1 dihydropteroate synthase [Chitinivibrionales bacterium]
MPHARHPSLSILDKPFGVMGVLNVTPDSFYDGGRYADPAAAAGQAMRLVEEGADVVDVGGESSRPGAQPVSPRDEIGRIVPVIEKLRAQSDVIISVDTTKSEVARAALDAGATWINDISAGRFDDGMASLAAKEACPVVLMHSRKTPRDMQEDPHYDDVLGEVRDELRACCDAFAGRGVSRENIIIDPGIGFAKRFEDNIVLLRNLRALATLGYPVLVGTSRKSFIGHITGRSADERLPGTLASINVAFSRGAKLFRVHDVKETVDFLKVLCAALNG